MLVVHTKLHIPNHQSESKEKTTTHTCTTAGSLQTKLVINVKQDDNIDAAGRLAGRRRWAGVRHQAGLAGLGLGRLLQVLFGVGIVATQSLLQQLGLVVVLGVAVNHPSRALGNAPEKPGQSQLNQDSYSENMDQTQLNQDSYNHPSCALGNAPEKPGQSQLNQDSYSENMDQTQLNQDSYNHPSCALGNAPEKPRSVLTQPGQLQ